MLFVVYFSAYNWDLFNINFSSNLIAFPFVFNTLVNEEKVSLIVNLILLIFNLIF